MDSKVMFKKLFDNADTIISSKSVPITEQDRSRNPGATYRDINLSDIASNLICMAGRWCESYASDFLVGWDCVRDEVTKHLQNTECEDHIEVFGFRMHGVDHDEYVKSRIELEGVAVYSKVYAVQISNTEDQISVVMKDITNEVQSASYHWREDQKFLKEEC